MRTITISTDADDRAETILLDTLGVASRLRDICRCTDTAEIVISLTMRQAARLCEFGQLTDFDVAQALSDPNVNLQLMGFPARIRT